MKDPKAFFPTSKVARKAHDALMQKYPHEICYVLSMTKHLKQHKAVAPIANPYDCSHEFNHERHDRYATHVVEIPYGTYIKDAVGNSFEYWLPGEAIWFNTNCGTGKSYFFRSLLDYYRSKGYKILYIGSRENLLNQMKSLVADSLKSKFSSWPPEYLSEVSDIDNFVYFASYQEIAECYRNGKRFRPDVFDGRNTVVFLDEVHWITSDALFSSATEIFLDNFFAQFRNAIKVFMTATDWDCYNVVAERLPSTFSKFVDGYTRRFIDVHTPFSYTYISESNKLRNAESYFFTNYEELIKMINDSEEKWLILVESKKQGKKLEEMIADSCFTFRESKHFAMSDEATEEKNNVIKNEKFDAKVLITTAVMDVGTNISDDEVINVVVDTYDPITAVQFVGRKRRKKSPLKVYLRDRSPEEVLSYLDKCVSSALTDMDLHYSGNSNIRFREKEDFIDLLHSDRLYYNDKILCNNHMAARKLRNMEEYLKHILWETERYGEKSFLRHQLELFGLPYSKCTDIMHDEKAEIRKNLISFVDKHVDKKMSTEEYTTFCKELDVFLDKLGTKDHRGADRYSEKKLNTTFAENNLNYVVANNKGNYTITVK